MAKQVAMPASPAPSPTPSSADSGPGPRAIAASLPTQSAPQGRVTYWDNDLQAGRSDAPAPRAETKPDPSPEGEQPAEKPADTPADGEAPTPEEKPPGEEPAAAAKPSATERRRAALEALAGERKRVELETTLKATQERLKEVEGKAVDPKAWVKGATLKEVLAARGMTRADLEDMLIRGAKDLDDLPATAQATPAANPDIDALKAQIADLTKKLTDRATKESEAEIQQAVNYVATLVKDHDIPVTHAVGGYELVMRTAHELWLASGKAGKATDYVKEAGDIAEEHFRKERPSLAALADRAKGSKPAAADADEEPRGITRRTASRPEARSNSLWTRDRNGATPTREEIDERIKREMGFVDKH